MMRFDVEFFGGVMVGLAVAAVIWSFWLTAVR